MKIELVFPNLSNDIKDAIADIHIENQSEADAPSLRITSKRIGPFTVSKSQPSFITNLDLNLDQNIPSNVEDLSLLVRVKSRTADEQPIEFLNTTTTSLPKNPSASLRIVLSRIR
ncbi:hypothetical protein C7B76_06055 [filamentous cyanobacterium CCP2]|nr:hypothetical protein C7B76_06055 [filamentous cyanobacterium CCP2]